MINFIHNKVARVFFRPFMDVFNVFLLSHVIFSHFCLQIFFTMFVLFACLIYLFSVLSNVSVISHACFHMILLFSVVIFSHDSFIFTGNFLQDVISIFNCDFHFVILISNSLTEFSLLIIKLFSPDFS